MKGLKMDILVAFAEIGIGLCMSFMSAFAVLVMRDYLIG